MEIKVSEMIMSNYNENNKRNEIVTNGRNIMVTSKIGVENHSTWTMSVPVTGKELIRWPRGQWNASCHTCTIAYCGINHCNSKAVWFKPASKQVTVVFSWHW